MVKNKKKIKVALIILTIGSEKLVKDEISQLSKVNKDGIDLHCYVINNQPKTKTIKSLEKIKIRDVKYRYFNTGKNLGFAGGNNFGISKALLEKCDYVIILNDDMVIAKDLFVDLVNFMKKNIDVGVCSPKIYFAKGYEFHKDRYSRSDLGKVLWYAGGIIDRDNVYSSHRGVDEVDVGQYDKVINTDFANGACMIIRSSVFKKVGLLDEALFLYWEDSDFCQRIKNNGYKVIYYPKTHVWHKVAASSGIGSGLNDYFLTRNRYFFAQKYAKQRTKFAVLRDTLRLSVLGREWERKGAVDALLARKGIGRWKKQ